jgi:NlpC/P60 family putative phage cell wall peptidase
MAQAFSTDIGARVVEIAREWIGTPYHHQMAVKGAGCDCLGLVRGVYGEVYGREPEAAPPYSRDWAEATGAETLIAAAERHLMRKSVSGICPGDVLIFRMKRGAMAKHAAILATPRTMIHAFENNAVCEVPLTPHWLRKIAAVFRFPDQPKF